MVIIPPYSKTCQGCQARLRPARQRPLPPVNDWRTPNLERSINTTRTLDASIAECSLLQSIRCENVQELTRRLFLALHLEGKFTRYVEQLREKLAL